MKHFGTRLMFAAVGVGLVAVALGARIAARADDLDVPWAAAHPSLLLVKLASAHSSYTPSQPIVLKFSITNAGGVKLRAGHVSPHVDFVLDIRDASGRSVEPTGENAGGVAPHHPLFLEPGQTFVDSDLLSEWGYDLKPGRYNIVADYTFVSNHRVLSNHIRIEVSR